MNYESTEEKRPGIGVLLSGIVSDVRDLFVHELRLARLEIGEDLQRVKSAAVMLAVGGAVAGIGVIVLVMMLVHLLDALTELPLWGCYGVVGGIMLLVGLGILLAGKKKTQHVGFVPAETAEAIKEDVGWIKARMKSNGSESRLAQR